MKTRLCPPLTLAEAAGLCRVSLEETVARLTDAGFAPVLFFDGDEAFFRRSFPGLTLIAQGDGGLGERLDRAFRRLFERGCRGAAMIGSDTPDLPAGLVAQAFAALEEAECVTSPSRDGGYVLVGLRRHVPELFRGIPWSTSGVLRRTRQLAEGLRLDYREIEPWEDMDDWASLLRLVERSPDCETAHFARGQILSRLQPEGLSEPLAGCS